MDTRTLGVVVSHAWADRIRPGAVGWLRATPPARLWRRSLSFRVVLSTSVLSAAVVIVLLVIVTNVVVSGLVSSQRSAAVAEARSGMSTLGLTLGDAPAQEEDLSPAMISLVDTLSSKGSQAGLFDVVLVPPIGTVEAVSSGSAGITGIPSDLRKDVEAGGELRLQYVTMGQSDGSTGPGLVVGGTVRSTAGPFALYYLFPLEDMADTAALVQRALLAAGFALILLLAGVAALVTRQVVTPVRQGRATAEKLAAGDLDVRMEVQGEDDLASLATSFNRMADSLQSQIGELERLSAVQRGFVSDVSHELRTPLTTLRMAADVIYSSRQEFPPDIARAAELLDEEVDRFERLLSDLLEISRHDANVATLDQEWVDVTRVVRREVESTRSLAERQGCDVTVFAPEETVAASLDQVRFERILRNLLGNALEHGQGAPVEVHVAEGDGAVAVLIVDHGRGLRPGESGLVFNRFYRGDTSRARTIGGSGLGLSISFEDARLHGGWLQAWGEPGVGARFRLTVPVNPGEELTSSPLPLEPESWEGADTTEVRVLSLAGGTPLVDGQEIDGREIGEPQDPAAQPDATLARGP